MSTVFEIEAAITKLPKDDFWKLADWFDKAKDEAWAERMESDAEAGKLDFLFEEASEARRDRTTKSWPAKK